jgi:hypothetical protein
LSRSIQLNDLALQAEAAYSVPYPRHSQQDLVKLGREHTSLEDSVLSKALNSGQTDVRP